MNAETKKPSETHMKPYKQWLLRLEELRGENGIDAYRRAVLLVKLYDDDDFRDEVLRRLDNDAVEHIMNDLIQDLYPNFKELREMLKHYPREDQWAEGKLEEMHKAIGDKDVGDRNEDMPVRKRKTATAKEVEHITKSRDLAKTQLFSADQRIAELREENEQLRQRVRELESQLVSAAEPAIA